MRLFKVVDTVSRSTSFTQVQDADACSQKEFGASADVILNVADDPKQGLLTGFIFADAIVLIVN